MNGKRGKQSSMVGSRTDLAMLCNAYGLGRAVEIGTDRGLFARDFLRRWHGSMLVCVDPYLPYGEMNRDRRADYDMACAVLAPFANRCRLIVERSEDIAGKFDDGWTPQFVYIDGDHSREAVARDIALWWEQVEPGGILSGHDYDRTHIGVVQAVDEFAGAKGLEVHLTTDYNQPDSWFIHKPKD